MAGNSVSPRAPGTNQFVSVYDWDVMLPAILDRLENGEHLQGMCAHPDMPTHGAVLHALYQRPELRARYEASKPVRAEANAESMDDWIARMNAGEIAPKDAHDAIKAIMVRMGSLNPFYRDRRVEHTGNVQHQVTHAVSDRLVRAREKAIEATDARTKPIDVTPTSKRIT
jgi:hypothetical protein